MRKNPEVAIVGSEGVVGMAYQLMFPDCVRYDEPKGVYESPYQKFQSKELGRMAVNNCDMAIVSVFTPSNIDGSLDVSTVREVVQWIDTPLILIKSALQPGTVDKLVEETGKNIAVSVEFIGEGNYYVPPEKYPDTKDPRKHKLLIVGGEQKTAEQCAEVLWSKVSPDARIHLVTALEAEMCKLIENSYGALKVTWANCVRTMVENTGQSFIRTHQAWTEDGRVDEMHTRSVAHNRGWSSKCWDKDITALEAFAREVGADDLVRLMRVITELNNYHIRFNDRDENHQAA